MRAFEIALVSRNPQGEFACHETTIHGEEGTEIGPKSQICKGFAILQTQEAFGTRPYPPTDNVYTGIGDMLAAYDQEWNR
jgi:hypothetical protein